MSKRKAPQRIDDSILSDDTNTNERRQNRLSELPDRNSLAFSEKRKRITNFNDLTQHGDFSQASTQRELKFNPQQQRCGIIETISLRNFKCHSGLDHTFCPYINFIVGRNGSKYRFYLF